MKITVETKLNIRRKEVSQKAHKATREGLRDVIYLMHEDTQKQPPIGSPYLTGNNRRLMGVEVSGMGNLGAAEKVCDPGKDEAALYSTSGYGGWLEIGTSRMPARPYIRPAFDRHKGTLSSRIKEHLSGSS